MRSVVFLLSLLLVPSAFSSTTEPLPGAVCGVNPEAIEELSSTVKAVCSAEPPKTFLVVDLPVSEKPELPANFRLAGKGEIRKRRERPIKLLGLDRLALVSGSGQLTEEHLKAMMDSVLRQDGKAMARDKIWNINLRWETDYQARNAHGRPFLITLIGPYNQFHLTEEPNAGLLEAAEQRHLKETRTTLSPAQIVLNKHESKDPALWATRLEKILTSSLHTERQVARSLGIQYVRMPVSDFHPPQPQVVDEFVKWAKERDERDWLHFHCHAGKGRTTTFIVMLDMLRNWDHFKDGLTAENIAHRHHAMGGADVLEVSEKADKDPVRSSWARSRVTFVRSFYEYCKAQGPHQFSVSYSEWLRRHL